MVKNAAYLVMGSKKYLAVSMNFLHVRKGFEEIFVKVFPPQCIYLTTKQKIYLVTIEANVRP